MTVLADLDRADAARWQPPPAPVSLYDFASRIRLHDGPLAGTFLNPRAERAIDLWLREVSSRRHKWHLIIAPSQRGKTLTGVVIPTLHALIEERVNVGWVMPSLDKLGQKWEGTIKPMIDGGGFSGYMPDRGPGSNGGRPSALTIRDPKTRRRLSSLYTMALGKGGSETSTASNPCARLLIDEADDAENAGQIKLAAKRTASYGAAGGGIVATTINERRGRDLHPALELLAESTQTRLAHLCPHCHVHVVPELEHFNVDLAAIACPSCGVIWSESDRHSARNNAEYRHANPDAEWFGVLYTAIDFFWEYPDQRTGEVDLVLPALAREHKAALAAKDRGDISQWNTYLRKAWCRPESAEDAEVPQTIDLHQAARCSKSPHQRGEIPPGHTVTTIGSDTGKRDAWWLRLAMKPDLSWSVVDWSVRTTPDHRAEPTPEQQRNMLDAMRERSSRIGRADAMGIDVGYNTDLVTKWAKANGFRMVRGDQRPTGKKDEDRNAALPSWAEERRQDDGSFWLFLDGAAIKAEIHKALAREPGQPGAGHLPQGQEAGDWLIRHLTSEVWDAKHGVWVKKPGRDNHLLDCLVYAWALSVLALNKPRMAARRYGKITSI